MARRVCLAASILALLALVGVPAQAAPAGAQPYIVMLHDGVSSPSVASEHARDKGAEVRHVYRHAINGYAARMTPKAAAEVAMDERVRMVSPDGTVSIEAQSMPTGIDRIDAELSSTVSGNGSGAVNVDVAVIDTGIDTTHPDLNVAGGINCSSGKPAAYRDGHGHGTHVAGTIGALDDGNGVVGVAPGARMWAVRVLGNNGSGSWSDVVCGVDWVTANAGTIEVANMSLGGIGTDPAASGCTTSEPLHDAICRSVAAGVTYAVAAGNSADDAKNHIPAAYDEVMTISALADFDGKPGGIGSPTCRTDVDDTLASFSNFGVDVDLIGPGVCILSTYKRGGYATFSGTSMASPHVAGAAALYKAANPSASPASVKTALQDAGTTDWNDSDDPDVVKEHLVNVATF